MKTEELFERAPVWKSIFKMCLPTVVIMLVMTVYNMADMVFVGQTGIAAQVAAVSLASPFFLLQMTLSTWIGGGGCTVISAALGAKNTEKAKAAGAACILLSLVGGILLGGAALLFPNTFLHFFGADAATWDYTAQYLQILALGTPVIVFSNVFANLVRAEGAVQTAVLLNMLGTVANIILDPLFISGLNLGVQGAAIATVFGNIFTACGLLFYLRRRDTILTLNMRKAFHMPHVFREIFALGIPGSVSNLLMSAVNTITNRIVIAYGADTVAEMGAGGKAGMIVAMVVMAIALGVQPMFAYLYGAGNTARLRETFRKSGILAVSLGIVLSVVCFIFRFPICGLFLKDEALVASAAHITALGLLGMPLIGVYYLAVNYLQSVGKAAQASVLSVLRQGAVYVPLLLSLHGLFGLFGVFYAAPAADIFSTLLAVFLLYRAIKKDLVSAKPHSRAKVENPL